MTSRGWVVVSIILALVILALLAALLLIPAPASAPVAPGGGASTVSTTTVATSTQPLRDQVSVSYPQPGATVSHSFAVAGNAPGGWFFEAVFPIQVRDADGNLLARGIGKAQGDWMTSGLVAFTSDTITIENYSGPATLILNKDNPSGLPENDDLVTIPIVIQ
jgi:hypothetical protein